MTSKVTKVKQKSGNTRWDERFTILAYEQSKAGASDNEIKRVLGISQASFELYRKKYPQFQFALNRGREMRNGKVETTFHEYIYKTLPPDLQELWDSISECAKLPNGRMRIEAMLANQGKQARQHLFLHALIAASFNTSRACKMVNISYSTLKLWMDTDPKFEQLIDEMHWHKSNFFESALINCVKQGDTAAIIFANRTFNAGRGYGVKKEVKHTHAGTVNHEHTITIDDMDLPLETRRELLKAIRRKQSQNVIESNPKRITHAEDDE